MLRIALVGMTFVLGGCFSTSRHGDAKVKLISEPFVLKSKNRTILLPEFSISEVGEHRFDVAELPVAMYPTAVAVPAGEFYHKGSISGQPPPWSGAVVRIRFINPEGVALHDRAVALDQEYGMDNNNDDPIATYYIFEDHYFSNNVALRHPLEKSTMEPCESYQIRVEVTTPSTQPGHVAYLRGHRSD